MLWKAWFDIRYRFLLCAILVALLVGPGLVGSAFDSVNPDRFTRWVDGWMNGMEHFIFAVLAAVLAVGGTMTESNVRSNLMTLSLPVPRGRWLISQCTVVTLLVLCLALAVSVTIWLAGMLAGRDVRPGALLVAAILNAFAAALWVWPSSLSTSLTKEAVRAGLLVVSAMLVLRAAGGALGLEAWSLERIADFREWHGSVPWRPLIAGLLLAGATAWLTLRRFERTDY